MRVEILFEEDRFVKCLIVIKKDEGVYAEKETSCFFQSAPASSEKHARSGVHRIGEG